MPKVVLNLAIDLADVNFLEELMTSYKCRNLSQALHALIYQYNNMRYAELKRLEHLGEIPDATKAACQTAKMNKTLKIKSRY
jgi:hypothetical protein